LTQDLFAELEWLQAFNDENFSMKLVDHPLLQMLETSSQSRDNLTHAMQDPNLMILFLRLKFLEEFEPDWKYKNAYINMERLSLILFNRNPWWRSRKGHEMWWYANYVNPDSYFILKWEDLYDPRKWYKPGEPKRIIDIPATATIEK
jgi:hypothetical protein